MPVTKGWVSDAPDARHSNVAFWPIPGDAALVELFVAGAVEALLAVAVPIAPAPADNPPVVEPDDEADELVAERPPPPVDGLNDAVGALDDDDAPPAVAPLVELVAMLSIVAPRPADPADAPPVELLAVVETDTVGALVSVAPEVTVADESVPVLDKVLPAVTPDDCAAPDALVEDGGAAGKPCTPLPT